MGGQESVIQSELAKQLQAKRRRCRLELFVHSIASFNL